MIKLVPTIKPLVEYDIRYADGPFSTRVYEARCFVSCEIEGASGLILFGEGRGCCVDAARALASSKVIDDLLSQATDGCQTLPAVRLAVDTSGGTWDGTVPTGELANSEANSSIPMAELHADSEMVEGEASNLQSKYMWKKAMIPHLDAAARQDAILQLASATLSGTIRKLMGTRACGRWVRNLLACWHCCREW